MVQMITLPCFMCNYMHVSISFQISIPVLSFLQMTTIKICVCLKLQTKKEKPPYQSRTLCPPLVHLHWPLLGEADTLVTDKL